MQRKKPCKINNRTYVLFSFPLYTPVFSKFKVSVMLYRKANRTLHGGRKFLQYQWSMLILIHPAVRCKWYDRKCSTLHVHECTVIAPQRDPDVLQCQDKILSLTASIYYLCWIICYCCMGTLETMKSVFSSRSCSALWLWRQWKRWHSVCSWWHSVCSWLRWDKIFFASQLSVQ